MKKYTMFLDRKTQSSDNEYTTQGDLLVHSFTIDTLRLNCGIPIQPPMVFFTELQQIISQCVWKHKRPPMSKAFLRNNGNGGLGLPDFRLYYKATVIKTVRYWLKDRNSDQWNKIGSPEMKPHTHSHLIFDRGDKNIWRRKDSLLDKQCWKHRSITFEEWNVYSFLTPQTKTNARCIKDRSGRPEITKLLEENTGRTLSDRSDSKILYDPPPRKMEIKTNKRNLLKLLSFCTVQDTKTRVKRQLSEWEKIAANQTTAQEMISHIYKQLMQLNTRKTKNRSQSGQKN